MIDKESVEITKGIILLKGLERKHMLAYSLIRQFWFGISSERLLKEMNVKQDVMSEALGKVMHLYPSVFYTVSYNKRVYFDWERIPLTTKQALRTNAGLGYVTLGNRRIGRDMVEKIPLGINCGTDMSLLWDYTKEKPRITGLSAKRDGNALYS